MRKRIPRMNQFGVSLVELILALTIISILSFVLMNFMINWYQQYVTMQTRANLLTQAQDTLDQVTNDIRLSAAADMQNRILDDNAPGAPANRQSWNSNAQTLILATAAEDASGNIIFSHPTSYTSEKNNTIYFLSNNVLYRRVLAASAPDNKAVTTCPQAVADPSCPADRLMARGVSAFSVRYYNLQNQEVAPSDARSVQLEITLQRELLGRTIQMSDKTRMVFRNE